VFRFAVSCFCTILLQHYGITFCILSLMAGVHVSYSRLDFRNRPFRVSVSFLKRALLPISVPFQ